MKKRLVEEHHGDEQELEILKAVAQAWHARNSTSLGSQDASEFDAHRLNFKSRPTRFRVEAINRSMASKNKGLRCSGRWDFGQSLWDSYEILAVSKKLETGMVLDNPFSDSGRVMRPRKESKNSLRNLFNFVSSRRFNESDVPRGEADSQF